MNATKERRITEIPIVANCRSHGFVALLTDAGEILVAAEEWTGAQPRLVLTRMMMGYRDWRNLLDVETYERIDRVTLIRFAGDPEAAQDRLAQWKTHNAEDLSFLSRLSSERKI